MALSVKNLVSVKLEHGHTGVGYVDEVKPNGVVIVIGVYVTLNASPWKPQFPPLSYKWEVTEEACTKLKGVVPVPPEKKKART